MNVYLYSSKTSKYFKTLPQFSYLFNQNAFIDMVRRSCSQTAYVICFSAKNNGLIFIVYVYQDKPQSIKILIIFLIKEDSHWNVINNLILP